MSSIAAAKHRNLLKNQIAAPTNVILHILFLMGVVICVYPVLVVIGSSLTDEDALNKFGYNVIPHVFSTYGYRYLATTGASVLHAYGVTFLITVVGSALFILFTSMYAYPLSRPEFPWRRGFSLFIYIPMLFSGGLIPYYIVVTQILHMGNTVFSLFVPGIFGGYYAFVLRTFITSNIPGELIESARIDGSTEFNTYMKIVLPLSKAGLATVAFFKALDLWNEWYNCMLFNSQNQKAWDLGYLLYKILIQIQYISQLGSAASRGAILSNVNAMAPAHSVQMALCCVAVGPIILIYPFFQRFFVKGLVIGAVKG